MKRILGYACMLAVMILFSCSGGNNEAHKFAGSFEDEFHNKFVLNEDYTATIQFAGNSDIIETEWRDGVNHDSPYATIRFNGDPSYYYLRDGNLYRHFEDMTNGRCAIKITYDD